MRIVEPVRSHSRVRRRSRIPAALIVGGFGLTSLAAWAGEGVVQGPDISWDLLVWLLPTFVLCILVLARVDSWAQRLRGMFEARREARRRPGSSPLYPVPVQSFTDIARRSSKGCTCGGIRKVIFEGGTPSRQRKLWLVIEGCPECQGRIQTYFDVTGVSEPAPLGSSPVTPASR
jgi:hypothetical protein